MPIILASDDTLSVAANADSGELVSADRIQIPDGGMMYLLAGGSATGLSTQLKVNGNDWTYDEELGIVAVAADLKFPDDAKIWGKVKKGDTVSLKFRNSTVGALNVGFRLVVVD